MAQRGINMNWMEHGKAVLFFSDHATTHAWHWVIFYVGTVVGTNLTWTLYKCALSVGSQTMILERDDNKV